MKSVMEIALRVNARVYSMTKYLTKSADISWASDLTRAMTVIFGLAYDVRTGRSSKEDTNYDDTITALINVTTECRSPLCRPISTSSWSVSTKLDSHAAAVTITLFYGSQLNAIKYHNRHI